MFLSVSHFIVIYLFLLGFTDDSVVKKLPANAGDPGLIPELGRFPWRRKWQPSPAFLPGELQGQRSPASCSPWGCKRVGHNLAMK